MKTPVGLRPATWEPRQRVVAAAVVVAIVAGLALWWVLGGDGRRAEAACDLYEEQRPDLASVLVETGEAADRAEEAGDDSVVPHFDDVDREFNYLRRWQSTTPQVERALDDVGDGGADRDVATALAAVTTSVAEMQRQIEDEEPGSVRGWLPELDAELTDAADVCGDL